jgi:hypothetical protein
LIATKAMSFMGQDTRCRLSENRAEPWFAKEPARQAF